MATTTNSDMIIYNDQVQTAYFEKIQDVLEVFNAASKGAIVMRSEALPGDFTDESFYTIPGGIEHRDVDSTGAATAKKLGSDEQHSVKSPWKYGPYETTEEAFKRRARSPEEFSQLLGEHMAEAMIAYSIGVSFAALEGAIGANEAMVAAGSFAADHKKVLTKGMRKFGDRFSRIAMFGMDSSTYFDLVDDAIDEKIYEEAGLVIYGGTPGTMGKPVLVTDTAPASKIFGLQVGAVQIVESQAPGIRSYNIDGRDNLMLGYQGEGAFNLELLGYGWKKSAGANPDKSTIGAGASWVKHASDDKLTAGVVIGLT